MAGAPEYLGVIQRRALLAGGAALAVCAIGAFASPGQFFRAYLVGFLFWGGIALGCTAFLMLYHLVGGGWGLVTRRLLESGTRTLPLLAALMIPLLFGLRYLYVWARPEALAENELLRHKTAYLNIPFFIARTAFYFACWLGLAFLLNKWSAEQDRDPSASVKNRLRNLSAPGLLLYGLTVSFAAVDWAMSLEPLWFSTIYGIVFMVGQGLTALAFVIAVLLLLGTRDPLADILEPDHLHDLGNLMLAFVMLWAYVSFSQFLIIWSGNLAEEIPWYITRLHGGWGWVAAALLAFHFVLPFLLLLSRRNKRRLRVLGTIAAAMLVIRLMDLLWIVVPAFAEGRSGIHWMDLLVPVGLGGIWIATFVWQLRGRPLSPVVESPLLKGAS
jgi:hypothetical protein